MTEHKNIAAALAAAQFQMGKALKDANNPHFRSKYADLSSVTGACMPALNANGIAVVQPLHTDETGRYIATRFIHTSGETLETIIPIIVGKNDMQGLGSAITYARRYGLMAMAGIAPEDDDGNAAAQSLVNNQPDETRAPPRQPDAGAVEAAIGYLDDADTLDELAARWGNIPKDMQRVPDVISAKNRLKGELQAAPKSPDLGDQLQDEIPHQ